MKQSRAMSLVEAITNVVVGYGLAILTQIVVFPWFGIDTSMQNHLAIGLAFVGVSPAKGVPGAAAGCSAGSAQARGGSQSPGAWKELFSATALAVNTISEPAASGWPVPRYQSRERSRRLAGSA